MKKIISIALLCAMLLSCFAGCAMQKGEVDVESYVEEAVAQDTAVTIPADWKNGLTAWDGTVNEKWYDASKTTLEIKDGKDLRAFLVEVRTNGNTFKDKVVKLVNNIDLGGKEWAAIISDTAKDNTGVFFAGEFNGDSKIIGNFKMTLDDTVADGVVKDGTNACATTDALTSHALLGSIGDGAYIHDLKVVGAEYIVNYKENSTTVVGGLFSEATNKVTLENLYISGSIKDTGSKGVGTVGGIVGKLKGNGPSVITNCVSNITISAKGSAVGGIVGTVNGGVNNVTISKCEVLAPVSGYKQTAGIVGSFGNTDGKTGLKATIQECQVKANITGTGDNTGGIIGNHSSKGRNLIIKDCNIASNVTLSSSGNANGGIIGIAGEVLEDENGLPQYSVSISGCTVSATLNFPSKGGQSGGIIGTANSQINTISECTFDGTMTADRSCGGFIGSIGGSGTPDSVKILNSKMLGTLHFDLKGNNNLYAGGFIGLGRVQKQLIIEGCVMGGTLNVTFNANDKSTTENAGAGGLVGTINDKGDGTSTNNSHNQSAKVYFVNNTINGTLNIQDKDNTKGKKPHYSGILAGNTSGVEQTLTVSGNVYTDGTKTLAVTGDKLGLYGDTNLLKQTADLIGYQTTEVVDGKYDLRIVASAGADVEALGFIVNIKYFDAEGKILGDKMVTEYVKTVYTSIKGDNKTYKASDYYADYLYTLTIKGIPASVTTENMGIQVHAIAADVVKGEAGAQDTIIYHKGAIATYGTYKSMASKNDVTIADSAEKPLSDTLAGVIGQDNTAEISKNLSEYKDNYYSGVAEIDGAVYPSTNDPYDKQLQSLRPSNVFTVTINAEAAGEYDIILELRSKDAGIRYTYMYINDQDGYFLHNEKYVNTDSYNSDQTKNSRFVKVGTCYLNEGRNTVTFKIDTEIGGVLHPRAIYFDAVAK